MRKKSKKPVWGVFFKSRAVSKKALAKIICFYKRYILKKHPQIAKKNRFKVWKIEFFAIFSNFYKGDSSKTQWIRKWKWHFCLTLSWKWQIPNAISPLQLPHSAMNAAHATIIIKRWSLYTSPEWHVFSCWVMCPLSPTFIYNFLNVIIYLMLTWLNQTTSCHMFYQHHPLYADLAHPYIYCFLNVFCIYADLYHPDPSYVQIFTYITHCMPTLLTHTSIAF